MNTHARRLAVSFAYPSHPDRDAFHRPLAEDGQPVSAGNWLRIDGLSYIGADTALFHMIMPLPAHAGTFGTQGERITLVGMDGAVFISHRFEGMREALGAAGYREADVPPYFSGQETLVEPNPRGISGTHIYDLTLA